MSCPIYESCFNPASLISEYCNLVLHGGVATSHHHDKAAAPGVVTAACQMMTRELEKASTVTGNKNASAQIQAVVMKYVNILFPPTPHTKGFLQCQPHLSKGPSELKQNRAPITYSFSPFMWCGLLCLRYCL